MCDNQAPGVGTSSGKHTHTHILVVCLCLFVFSTGKHRGSPREGHTRRTQVKQGVGLETVVWLGCVWRVTPRIFHGRPNQADLRPNMGAQSSDLDGILCFSLRLWPISLLLRSPPHQQNRVGSSEIGFAAKIGARNIIPSKSEPWHPISGRTSGRSHFPAGHGRSPSSTPSMKDPPGLPCPGGSSTGSCLYDVENGGRPWPAQSSINLMRARNQALGFGRWSVADFGPGAELQIRPRRDCASCGCFFGSRYSAPPHVSDS